jgi:ubiquinone/menaquinone biosynthesis C-methylase UbiE
MHFDHFDFLAPFYDRVIRFDRLETTLQMAALPADGLLLDAGGGTGRVAASLRPYVSGIVLADLSLRMLLQARSKGLSSVLTPTERLPFPDQIFSRVLMVDALHHVIHQTQTVHELWRVLAPGGRLVIEEPDVRTTPVKWIALAEKLALMRSHFLKPEEIAATLPSQASVRLETQDYTVWVIAEKPVS